MKNIELWSREIDKKLLIIGSSICALALAAAIGSALPAPTTEIAGIHFFDAFITVMLLIAVWGAFRLIRPVRFGQRWLIAEVFTVPSVWLILVIALACWLGQLYLQDDRVFELLRPMNMASVDSHWSHTF